MTGDEFAALLNDLTLSAESGDGARFARHFTEDAIYYDYIYGAHSGRADIAHMMQGLFHRDAADYRWEMFDPVFDAPLVAIEIPDRTFLMGTGQDPRSLATPAGVAEGQGPMVTARD